MNIKKILLMILSLVCLSCTSKFKAKQYNIILEDGNYVCRYRMWEAGPNYIGPSDNKAFRVPFEQCQIVGFQVNEYVELVNWAEELRIRSQQKEMLRDKDATEYDPWVEILKR